MDKDEQERYYQESMRNWRSWGSWFSWGSPVGLGLFFVLAAIAVSGIMAAIHFWA